MASSAEVSNQKPTLHPEFVDKMVMTFNDSDEHGVHLLFNEWWSYAPDVTIERYLANFHATPDAKGFLDERHFGETLGLEELEAMPRGTLGRVYYEFLTDNGLEKNLATNYKMLHDALAASGRLDRMPPDLQYAIIRGFQIHDLLHAVTGYTPDGLDELALQAFCLAQLQFPYFGMWMATTTSRMTFLQPDGIIPVMDAISSGWQLGRSVSNLQFEKWEQRLLEPVAELRPRYGLPAEGVRP